MSSRIQRDALRLDALGMVVIPIRKGTKLPAIRWAKYQRQRPSKRALCRWFERDDVGGLAIIHGMASQGIAARDFDSSEAYKNWANAHRPLAATLPTAKTSRGFHVYFRLAHEQFVRLPDGELRGSSRCYSVAPPSMHPSGKPYRWTIPLQALPPVLSPVESGFLCAVEPEQNNYPLDISNISRGTQQLDLIQSEESLGGIRKEIQEVIGRTLPARYGQRNHCLFRLARRLKAIPQFATAKADELLPVVRAWWELARPNIRTQDWRESWKDFAVAWERVRSPGEGEVLSGVHEWVCRRADDPLLRLELACEVIHERQNGQQFYLACRTAAALIGVSKSSAARLIEHLVTAGILR